MKPKKIKLYDPGLRISQWAGHARKHPNIFFIARNDADKEEPFTRESRKHRDRERAMVRWAIDAFGCGLEELDPIGHLLVLPPAVAGMATKWWNPIYLAVNMVSLFHIKGFVGPIAVRLHEFDFIHSKYSVREDLAFKEIRKVDIAYKEDECRYDIGN